MTDKKQPGNTKTHIKVDNPINSPIVYGHNTQITYGIPSPEPAPTQAPSLRTKVFISYRRSVSQAFAQYLQRLLLERLDPEQDEVFLDVHNIGPGPFAPKLEQEIRSSDYFLPVIQKGTLDRIYEPNDWLCKEIEIALDTPAVTIIPILVDDTPRPQKKDLPPSIVAMLDNTDVCIHQTQFEQSVDHLVQYYLQK